MSKTCLAEGCERGGKISRGLCNMHYQRARAHGATDDLPRAKRAPGDPVPPCSIDGCTTPAWSRGWCATHYDRWHKHGNPLTVLSSSTASIKGEFPTYSTIHWRLAKERGPASASACVDCGNAAAEWAYNNADPNPQFAIATGGFTVAYSLDLANYDPRCRPCHRRFDALHATDNERKAS